MVIEVYRTLIYRNKEYVLSKQMLKSGTSIGANIQEAYGGYSRKDFRAKMSIAYKEARETEYWLNLLYESKYLKKEEYSQLFSLLKEILKMLFSIIRSSR